MNITQRQQNQVTDPKDNTNVDIHWADVNWQQFEKGILDDILTTSQKESIRYIRSKMERKNAYKDSPEWKEFTITVGNFSNNLIYVIAEIGSEGDDDTLAAMFCRERRHLKVGRHGGLKLLNAKDDKKVTGDFDCLNELTR